MNMNFHVDAYQGYKALSRMPLSQLTLGQAHSYYAMTGQPTFADGDKNMLVRVMGDKYEWCP